MQRQPTLLNSCAMAATAAEARFRIDYPDVRRRSSRIIALDELAAGVVRRLSGRSWGGGRFLVFEQAIRPVSGGDPVDAALRAVDGSRALLSDELEDADVAVMIATANLQAEAASIVGDLCALRRIMSAALVIAGGGDVDETVSVLRPNAMVLLVLGDENDIPSILTALRV